MKPIEDANKEALARIVEGEPKLVDIVPARDALPGPEGAHDPACRPADRVGAHVRPDARRGAGAIVFEGWAPDLQSRHRSSPQAAASPSIPTIISAPSAR